MLIKNLPTHNILARSCANTGDLAARKSASCCISDALGAAGDAEARLMPARSAPKTPALRMVAALESCCCGEESDNYRRLQLIH